MIPSIAQHDVTVFLGDAVDVLASLPACSVQCVVTSPPYYGLRDYGVTGQLGLESSPAEYVAAMVRVFRESRRVLADDGVLWLNIGDSYSSPLMHNDNAHNANRAGTGDPKARAMGDAMGRVKRPMSLPAKNLLGIPWRVAFALQDDGWTLRAEVIWSKRNCMPEAVTDRPSRSHEQVFLFSKSRRYWYNADAIREDSDPDQQAHNERYARVYEAHDSKASMRVPGQPNNAGIHSRPGKPGRNARSVWTISAQPFPGAHFATMPPELARRCILAGCPDTGTVYDPFTGSGTTAMVARQLGRRFTGSELNPDYIPIIEQRIGQEPFQFGEVPA